MNSITIIFDPATNTATIKPAEEALDTSFEWVKISKFCKDTGLSTDNIKKVFKDVIKKPKGGIYMINKNLARGIIEKGLSL